MKPNMTEGRQIVPLSFAFPFSGFRKMYTPNYLPSLSFVKVVVANEQRSALDTFLSAATAANFNVETRGVREVGNTLSKLYEGCAIRYNQR